MSNRIFYAIQSVAVAKDGTNTFTGIHGLQSLGINTKFNLEQVFEMGQVQIYQNVENVPDIEVTMEKVLDGYPLIYHLMTNGSTSPSLTGRSAARSLIGLSIYGDTQDSASGVAVSQCTMSGMFVGSLNYDIQVNGFAKESCTAVGNNKVWTNAFTGPTFNNADVPLAVAGSGGANRRQDILFGPTSTVNRTACLLPTDIPGITASGTNEKDAGGNYAAHIQSIKVSCNLGRQQMQELGRKGPYFRFIQFPVPVKCDIETYSLVGDKMQALEEADNVTNQQIYIAMREGTKIDLGPQNKCESVTYGGANAGTQGGNATMSYSYLGFSFMTVTHPQDPSGL